MKRNKVLLGLFAGVLALIGGSAQAQQSKFFEIGPSNIGGQVSCLAFDQQDLDHTTLFAGATTGGLYVRTDNVQNIMNIYEARNYPEGWKMSLLPKIDMWHYVPYYGEDGKEVVLPISAMLQLPSPSRNLLIGTGSDTYQQGSNFSRMSVKGRGLFLYNIDSCTFKPVASTKDKDDFTAVHAMKYVYRNGTMYLYVATSTGLYRWTISSENDWMRNYETVFTGDVDQLVVNSQLRMVFFSVGGSLYKISDATADIAPSNPIWRNISSTNSAFGNPNGTLKLAIGDDPSYLYAMVILPSGYMDDVYLTRDMQTWLPLATSSVVPFSANSGFECGTITVDPGNPDHIFVAGTNIYSGTGFSEGSLYQWMSSSMSEFQLNSGDYMQYVYSNSYFVHSGIQQILPVYRNDMMTYYIATNGGVYSTHLFNSYENLNNGLNNIQINGLAVCPDGSILSGANDNACPFIESRTAHVGGSPEISWFDDGTNGNINHTANIIWYGTGGKVAASKFQQVSPSQRRNIYVSGENGQYARSFTNYYDFTDNQVWTTGSGFMTSDPRGGGPAIGQIYTWETNNDIYFNDSLTVKFDTMSLVYRPNSNGSYDTIEAGSSNFVFIKNDKVSIMSRANSDYPFDYEFQGRHKITDSIRVKNPIQSRVLFIAQDSIDNKEWGVYYSWRASDFTKVFDVVAQADPRLHDRLIFWSKIYANRPGETNIPRNVVMSDDGRFAFVSVVDTKTGRSMLIRIGGFENVDLSQSQQQIMNDFKTPVLNRRTKLVYDTLKVAGNVWMPRPVSSLSILGDSVVMTFDVYTDVENNNFPNVVLVTNIKGNMNAALLDNSFKGQPAFTSIVEKTTGDIFVGIDNGVMIYKKSSNSWEQYENLTGVPVTAIVQQQDNLPVRRHTTVDGINRLKYVFAKTKWPNAIYFGTYGRGIFADMTYVTDTVNEVSDSSDYLGIPTVVSSEMSSVSVYPNPVWGEANLSLTTAVAGQARLRIYDLNGRVVVDSNLGYAAEGSQTYTVSTEGMSKGMYLVNVIIGGHTAATKMMVR